MCVCVFQIYLYSLGLGKGCHIGHVWDDGMTSKSGPCVWRYVMPGLGKIIIAWLLLMMSMFRIQCLNGTSQCVQFHVFSLFGGSTSSQHVWDKNASGTAISVSNLCSSRWNMTRIHVGLSEIGFRTSSRLGNMSFSIENYKIIQISRGICHMSHTPFSIKPWSCGQFHSGKWANCCATTKKNWILMKRGSL